MDFFLNYWTMNENICILILKFHLWRKLEIWIKSHALIIRKVSSQFRFFVCPHFQGIMFEVRKCVGCHFGKHCCRNLLVPTEMVFSYLPKNVTKRCILEFYIIRLRQIWNTAMKKLTIRSILHIASLNSSNTVSGKECFKYKIMAAFCMQILCTNI